MSTGAVVRGLATFGVRGLRPIGALVFLSRVRRYPGTEYTVGFLIRSNEFSCVRSKSLLKIQCGRIPSCTMKFRRVMCVCPVGFGRCLATGKMRRSALGALRAYCRGRRTIPGIVRRALLGLFTACVIIKKVPSIMRACMAARSIKGMVRLREDVLGLCERSVSGCSRDARGVGVGTVFSDVTSRLSSGGEQFFLGQVSRGKEVGQCKGTFL